MQIVKPSKVKLRNLDLAQPSEVSVRKLKYLGRLSRVLHRYKGEKHIVAKIYSKRSGIFVSFSFRFINGPVVQKKN